MNDQEAIDAIAEVLEDYYRARITPYEALNKIAQIKGENEMRRQQ